MPTVLYEKGFRLFFYSDERSEPPHVHVQCQSAAAKFWIRPVSVARNLGMKAPELRRAFELVLRNEKLIQERWNEYFGKKS